MTQDDGQPLTKDRVLEYGNQLNQMAMQLQDWVRQQQLGEDVFVVEGNYNNRRPITKLGTRAGPSPSRSRSRSLGNRESPHQR